ncbi:flagellar protein FliT [Metabacillus herbersteinensis]|uniref:Flagellar protein FliT n=1 Tax=Metabacillus herbersteinensis TaxID=283816 RepID=A0ABV6GG96_9BACI
MSAVQAVYQITEKLVKLVETDSKREKRDKIIDSITSHLDKREELVHQLKPPYTKEEEQQMKQVISWNELITKQFFALKDQVKKDITQLKNTKSSANKYVNPYQNATVDGRFYDKRK